MFSGKHFIHIQDDRKQYLNENYILCIEVRDGWNNDGNNF
jgi:hypothetical protein